MIKEAKYQGESINMEFDFLSRCSIGETLTEYDASISVVSGEDPDPAPMLGVADVGTTAIWLPVVGGLPGVIYSIAVAGRTTRNNVYVVQALVAVKTDTSE